MFSLLLCSTISQVIASGVQCFLDPELPARGKGAVLFHFPTDASRGCDRKRSPAAGLGEVHLHVAEHNRQGAIGIFGALQNPVNVGPQEFT
jgi:hypothetical protein